MLNTPKIEHAFPHEAITQSCVLIFQRVVEGKVVPCSSGHDHVYCVASKQNQVVVVVDLTCLPLIIAGTSKPRQIPSHSLHVEDLPFLLNFIFTNRALTLTFKRLVPHRYVRYSRSGQRQHNWATLHNVMHWFKYIHSYTCVCLLILCHGTRPTTN
ncbi:hypothetical protein ACSQ67_014912 [Phaseolus vulgaris]